MEPYLGISTCDMGQLSTEELETTRFSDSMDPQNVTEETSDEFRDQQTDVPWPGRLSQENTPAREDNFAEFQLQFQSELQHYHKLLADGGRPTHHPKDALSIFENFDSQSEIIRLFAENDRYDITPIRRQWEYWLEFRKEQDRDRYTHEFSDFFQKHKKRVENFRKKKGFHGGVWLSADRKMQSNLDDWKELQCNEHARLGWRKKKIEEWEEKARLRAAKGGIWKSQERFDKEYADHKKEEKRQTIRIRWIDEQVSIMEDEARLAMACDEQEDHGEHAASSGREASQSNLLNDMQAPSLPCTAPVPDQVQTSPEILSRPTATTSELQAIQTSRVGQTKDSPPSSSSRPSRRRRAAVQKRSSNLSVSAQHSQSADILAKTRCGRISKQPRSLLKE